MGHWMEIARRRGESPPDRAALIRVLDQQRWFCGPRIQPISCRDEDFPLQRFKTRPAD
jgi:hypothetical protein